MPPPAGTWDTGSSSLRSCFLGARLRCSYPKKDLFSSDLQPPLREPQNPVLWETLWSEAPCLGSLIYQHISSHLSTLVLHGGFPPLRAQVTS